MKLSTDDPADVARDADGRLAHEQRPEIKSQLIELCAAHDKGSPESASLQRSLRTVRSR